MVVRGGVVACCTAGPHPGRARRAAGPVVLGCGVDDWGDRWFGCGAGFHLVTEHRVGRLVLASRPGFGCAGCVPAAGRAVGVGTQVEVVAYDVSDPVAVRELVGSDSRIERGGTPSAIFDDQGVISSLTPDRMDAVLAAKADAAWYLHEATEHLNLSTLVLYSF